MKIQIKINDARYAPHRAHPSDAGADLRCTTDCVIQPGGISPMLDTGVALKIPFGHVGLVFSRSGQSKLRVSLANSVGVIDSDYRGNVKAFIVNDGTEPYVIEAGVTKILQLVIVPIVLADFYTGNNEEWDDTVRGVGGFGSTGQ